MKSHLLRLAGISRVIAGGLIFLVGLVPAVAGQQYIYGWLEEVKLKEAGVVMEAKLDTGADNSSVHAPDAESFEKDGKTWVRFTLQGIDGKPVEKTLPLVRQTSIRRHGREPAIRYVVRMTLQIGEVDREVEVNLADRENFDYPLLIGRSFLEGRILVDSARAFTLRD